MNKNERHRVSSQSNSARLIALIICLGLLSVGLTYSLIKVQLRVNELTAQLNKSNNTINDFDFRNERSKKLSDHPISSSENNTARKNTLSQNCSEIPIATPDTPSNQERESSRPTLQPIAINRQDIMELANDVLVIDHKPVINDITTIEEIETAFQYQAADSNLSITQRLDALESMEELFHEELDQALVTDMLDAVTTSNNTDDQIELLDSIAGMVTTDHADLLIHLYGSTDETVSTLALLRLTELSDNDLTKSFLIEALRNNPKVTLDLLAAATQ